MKILSSVIFVLLAATAAKAEVKPAGSVVASLCGVSFSPVMSYKTVAEFCTAQVVGSQRNYILIRFENSTQSKVYQVVNKKQTQQGSLVQFSLIGFLEQGRIKPILNTRAETGKAFFFNRAGKFAVRGTVDGSDIMVRSLQPMFHTMSVAPQMNSFAARTSPQIEFANYSCRGDKAREEWVIDIQLSQAKNLNKAEFFDNNSWETFGFIRANQNEFLFASANGDAQIEFFMSRDGQTGSATYRTRASHQVLFNCKKLNTPIYFP